MREDGETFVGEYFSGSLEAMQTFTSGKAYRNDLFAISDTIAKAFRSGRKVLIAGNGGSAGDAQHMAGEFVSRLMFDHQPLAAIALTTDTSVLTAVGNDYGYECVFERQVLGLGGAGDVFVGISTSGKSPNIIRALKAAKQNQLITVGLSGSSPCMMDDLCDHILHAPSPVTAIIQQIHITAIHVICGLVEREMFPDKL